MCIGSNSVNQAQDLIFVTKFEDFPNSLLPPSMYSIHLASPRMTSSDLGGSQTGTWRPVARLLNTMRTPLARDRERMVAVAQLWVSTWGGIPW